MTNGALDRLLRLAEHYPEEVQEAAYDALVDDGDAIPQALAQNPPPFTGKRDWQSERQRRAYFATNGFGKGIPYQRQGAHLDAYDLGFQVTRGTISITLINRWDKSRFVVGGLRLTDPITQQRMHIQGGWQPVAPRIVTESVRFRAKVIRYIRLIPSYFA